MEFADLTRRFFVGDLTEIQRHATGRELTEAQPPAAQ